MAVQQNRKSRSRRDKRRSHDRVILPTMSQDDSTGEVHVRHHMTKNGFYRGKQIKIIKDTTADDQNNEQETSANANQ